MLHIFVTSTRSVEVTSTSKCYGKKKKCLEPILLQAEENVLCYISTISQPIAVKFWILNLMTKPNKPYDTTPRLDPSI